jgi:hypothetical protein
VACTAADADFDLLFQELFLKNILDEEVLIQASV